MNVFSSPLSLSVILFLCFALSEIKAANNFRLHGRRRDLEKTMFLSFSFSCGFSANAPTLVGLSLLEKER